MTTLLASGTAQAQTIPDLGSYFNQTTSASTPTGPSSPVDLLFESNSYVPPFYHGRDLPGAGSEVRLVALAHFGGIPDSEITYTWSIDGRVEGEISGDGQSSVVLPAPPLFGENTISVDAKSDDGSAYGSASITLSPVDPQPTLYLDNPLFGIEYYNALGKQNSVSDVETTFAAVPYFLAAPSPDSPGLLWQWSVNNQPVDATTSGSEITLNAANSNDIASLAVSLTSSLNPLLDGQGAWNFLFSPAGQ